jgi:hypothetical protein
VGKTSKGGLLLWASEEYYSNKIIQKFLTADLPSFISCTAQLKQLPLTLLYSPAISVVRPAENHPLLLLNGLRISAFLDCCTACSNRPYCLLKNTAWYGPVHSSRYGLFSCKNSASASCPKCPEIAPQQAAQTTQPVALFLSPMRPPSAHLHLTNEECVSFTPSAPSFILQSATLLP